MPSSAVYTPLPTSNPTYPPSHVPYRNQRSFRARIGIGVLYTGVAILALLGVASLFGHGAVLLSGGASEEGKAATANANATAMEPLVVHVEEENKSSLEELVQMVQGSEGFYARDYSLWLGWNNVRYITETALLHASLLNRTLILPSFVYMRACEFAHASCAAFAKQVNRGDAVNSDEWRQLSEADQQAWVMPLGHMLDVELLRSRGHRAVTTAEFLEMHGLELGLEHGDGGFPMEDLPMPQPQPGLEYAFLREPLDVYRIENGEYDSGGVVRVDLPFPDEPAVGEVEEGDVERVRRSIEEERDGLLLWEDGARLLKRALDVDLDDRDVERWARQAGYEQVYGLGEGDMVKTVAARTSHMVPRSQCRSFFADFRGRPERIVHLRGEIHLGRPPGGMRFTTPEARDAFGRMALWDVRPVREVEELAEVLARRMDERVEGRMWLGAHMRRGDFVRFGWTQGTVEQHLGRIRQHLRNGMRTIEGIKGEGSARAPDAPDCELDTAVWERDLPQDGDPFYLATDDRGSLGAEHAAHALLLADLLTSDDRAALVGWPLLFTDVLAEVEQEVLARAAFFYGSKVSSVAGGVLNARARAGRDARTAFVD